MLVIKTNCITKETDAERRGSVYRWKSKKMEKMNDGEKETLKHLKDDYRFFNQENLTTATCISCDLIRSLFLPKFDFVPQDINRDTLLNILMKILMQKNVSN